MTARILCLYSTLEVGGSEHLLASLAPRLRERGFDISVATLRSAGRYFEQLADAGFPAAHIGMRSWMDVSGLFRAYGLWRSGPAIVLTHGTDASFVGHLVSRRAGAGHVAVEGWGGGPPGRRRLALKRAVAPHVDSVVGVSRLQVPELLRRGYRPDSIRVIPNGVADVTPERLRSETRAELGLIDDNFVALLVASLRPEKRVDVFIDATEIAHARDRRVQGVVAGGGPELDAIRRRASNSGCVHVLGERSDIPDLMACADVVCLSSDSEGMPLVLLEAMAAARPVIATAVGGVPELLSRPLGRLVPRRDPQAFAMAMLDLAHAPGERKVIGAEARTAYESLYTLERMEERWVDLFVGLVEEHSSAERR